jgi:hypothetical protein
VQCCHDPAVWVASIDHARRSAYDAGSSAFRRSFRNALESLHHARFIARLFTCPPACLPDTRAGKISFPFASQPKPERATVPRRFAGGADQWDRRSVLSYMQPQGLAGKSLHVVDTRVRLDFDILVIAELQQGFGNVLLLEAITGRPAMSIRDYVAKQPELFGQRKKTT